MKVKAQYIQNLAAQHSHMSAANALELRQQPKCRATCTVGACKNHDTAHGHCQQYRERVLHFHRI